jgi:hypothetical protein
MMRAWSETPVIIEVAPDVLVGSGTLFVPGNSAWSGFDAETLRQLTGSDAFERLWLPGSTVPVSQSEVWVRSWIPVGSLVRLHVEHEGARESLRRHLASQRSRPMPDIQVTPGLYD